MSGDEQTREKKWFAEPSQSKCYRRGNYLVKRCFKQSAFNMEDQHLYKVPRLGKEMLMNEAASLRYIRQHTSIPVPTVYREFEDDDAYYLVTEYLEGAPMSSLPSLMKDHLQTTYVDRYIAMLQTLKSSRIGGPSGIVIPPSRVLQQTGPEMDNWRFRPSDHDEYIFCHNNLSQSNVIIDPRTWKVKAVIGWEYAGFYPPHLDWSFFGRLGPSRADESDDSLELLEFLKSQMAETDPSESTCKES